MPLQGNLSYANFDGFYQGLPVDEIKALNQSASQQYKTNRANMDALDVLMNNLSVEDRANPIKMQAIQELKNKFKGVVASGAYQDADYAVADAVKSYQNNIGLRDAVTSKQQHDAYYADLNKRYKEGKLNEAQYKYAVTQAKLKNQDPLEYDPETMTTKNMFSGVDVYDDKSKEIHDFLDKFIKDWKPESIIERNGKSYKKTADGQIINIQTGERVSDNELRGALRTELENVYRDYLSQERQIEHFNRKYNPETKSLNSIERKDLVFKKDDDVKKQLFGYSLEEINEKLKNPKLNASDKAYFSDMKAEYEAFDLSSPEDIKKAYNILLYQNQISRYTEPFVQKGAYEKYDDKFINSVAYEEAIKAYRKAEEEVKNMPLAFPTGQSNVQFTSQDYNASVQESANLKNKIKQKEAELAKVNPNENPVIYQNLQKDLDNLKHLDSVNSTNHFETVKKLSASSPEIAQKYVERALTDILTGGEIGFAKSLSSAPANKFTPALTAAIRKYESTISALSDKDVLSAEELENLKGQAKQISKMLLKEKNGEEYFKQAVNQVSSVGETPPDILNSVNQAIKTNPNFNLGNTTTRYGVDQNSDKTFYKESIDQLKSLIANTTTDWKVGGLSLDEIVNNPETAAKAGFQFSTLDNKGAKPDLSKSQIVPESHHSSGLNTVSIKFYDSEGKPLKFKGDEKDSNAVISFVAGDQEGLKRAYLNISSKLKNSPDPDAKKQGYSWEGFARFGQDLHDVDIAKMNKDEEKAVILHTKQGDTQVIIKKPTESNKGFEAYYIDSKGKRQPLNLIDYQNKVTNTFGSKEQLEELLVKAEL